MVGCLRGLHDLHNKGWVRFSLFLFLGTLGWSSSASAECVELKNDAMVDAQMSQVKAVRSFCISEGFGTIFTAPKKLVIQKVRLLVAGDGKNPMEATPIAIGIYKEASPTGVDPGDVLLAEAEFLVSGQNLTPQWAELDKLSVVVEAGTKFRVIYRHLNLDCELRVPDRPLCAEACQWWSATIDAGPVKPATNVFHGAMFGCPTQGAREWRYWENLPQDCRPTGNLILRAYGFTGEGKDCSNSINPNACSTGETRTCACQGGQAGTQTCTAPDTWGACQCTPPQTCAPNTTQACTCAPGQNGTQTCSSQGQWLPCQCVPPKECEAKASRDCTCTDGKSGKQTCGTDSKWGTCVCPTTQGCTPGASQKCACTDGKEGAQSCQADGKAWEACKCVTDGPNPIVTKITPSAGLVTQNTDVTVIGENFQKGAKLYIDTYRALDVEVLGDKSLTGKVPVGLKPGKYAVIVENPDGKKGKLDAAFSAESAGCGCSGLPLHGSFPVEIMLAFFALLVLRSRRLFRFS